MRQGTVSHFEDNRHLTINEGNPHTNDGEPLFDVAVGNRFFVAITRIPGLNSSHAISWNNLTKHL